MCDYWHFLDISIHDVNVVRMVAFNKIPFAKKGFKYFIRYEDDFE